jgi:hypothetical protein
LYTKEEEDKESDKNMTRSAIRGRIAIGVLHP